MHRGWNRWALVLVLGMTALFFADARVAAGVKKKDDVGEKKKGEDEAPKSIAGTTILNVSDTLSDKDERDPDAKDNYCKIYKIKLKAGKKYQFDLRSPDFDSYLTLRDKDGTSVAENDDGGGGFNARIVFPATADGEYKIYASTFEKNKAGKFTLAVIEGADATTVAAAPGKPIPLKLEATKTGSEAIVKAELTDADAKDKDGKHFKVYTVELQGGKRYAIYMKGVAKLDAFVRLEDAGGKKVVEDEFGEPNESGVKFAPDKTATFRIVATTFKGGMTGKFILSVTQDNPKAVVSKDGGALKFQNGQPTVVQGMLANTDPKDDKGKHFKTYSFEAVAGKTYKFEMAGQGGLDPLVRVQDAAGTTLKDEDDGDGKVSRLAFTAKQSGTCKLVATTFKAGATGNYILTAAEGGTAAPPPAAVAKAEPLAVAEGKSATVNGKLTAAEPKDAKGRHFKAYALTVRPGRSYQIELSGSGGLDPELRIEDANGVFVAKEDFGNGKLSRIAFAPTKAGVFRIIAGAYKAGATGEYTLTVADVEVRPAVVVAMPGFQKVTVTEIVGQLTDSDGIDKTGKRFKIYTFKAQPNKLYRVEMNGRTFDAQLGLADEKGQQIKGEDFFDGRFSQLFVPPDQGGVRRIIASSASPKQLGAFSLTITEVQPRQPAVQTITFERVSRVNGKITVMDGIDGAGKFFKAYILKTQPGMSYRCEMMGASFDAVLRLEDENGKLVKTEDFIDGKFSRLIFTADQARGLRLIATTFKPGQVGEFALSIAESEKDTPATKKPAGKGAKTLKLSFEKGKATVNGTFSDQDAQDAQGKFFKAYALPPGKAYLVELTGKSGLDPFVRIEDGAGKIVQNEKFGDGKVSRLSFDAPKLGDFRIIASSFKASATGDFTLVVTEFEGKKTEETKKTIEIPKKTEEKKDKKSPAGKPLNLNNSKDVFDDALTAKDATDPQKKHFKAYALTAKKGKTYRFEMTGKGGLDPQLRVEDADGQIIRTEDFGDGKVSRLFFTPLQTGPVRVVASTFKGGMTGDFNLAATEFETKLTKAEPLKFDMGRAVVDAALTEADGMLVAGNKYCKEYTFQATAGQTYKIDLHSKEFDAFLYLKNATGKTLAQNDDNGEGKSLDSRIVWKAAKAGTFHIIATTLISGSTGRFVLTVGEPSATEKLMARAGELHGAAPAERKQIVADLRKHFGEVGAKLSQTDALVAVRVGVELESTDKQLAAETYASFGKLFAAASDVTVARQAKIFAGAGRRLTLIGNAMQLAGTTIDGKQFDLSKLKGKVVLVDFWATWCLPCRQELPNLKKLYEKYHGQGFEVIGISLDKAKSDVVGVRDELKLPWTFIFEQANDLADDYGVFLIPLTVLVGRDGRVVSLQARGAELERLLAEQFSKK
jgi:thiol-disulfide isomerase/thioredoxin